MSKFTEKDFLDAGFTSDYFTNLKYIARMYRHFPIDSAFHANRY